MTAAASTGAITSSPKALGLSSAEARHRLEEFGANAVETGRRFWVFRALLSLLLNPLVLILLAASLISGALGEGLNATLIALMIVFSLALNFLQMFRSEQASALLRSMIRPLTRVWRDGEVLDLPVSEVVPHYPLELRAGDLVSADATLLTASTLSVEEAARTGE